MKKSRFTTEQTIEFIMQAEAGMAVSEFARQNGFGPASFFAWLDHPMSDRALEDARLLRLIRASFTVSHGIYCAPRVFLDLRERGETCSKHRVARLMRENGRHTLHGYRIRHIPVTKPHALIPNVLQSHSTAGYAMNVQRTLVHRPAAGPHPYRNLASRIQ